MKEKPGRRLLQYGLALLVPLVIIGGLFWPWLGFLAAAMMVLMLTLMFFRGRWYCGWLCAMGAFHERMTTRVSLHRDLPPLFTKPWFRGLFFLLLMGLMITRLIQAGGDPEKTAAVFVMMWTVATVIALAFGVYFKPRAWCSFCPMGTIQGIFSPKTFLLQVNGNCSECGICRRVCPIQTFPGAYKNKGEVPSLECMRCKSCVENCPKKALTLPSPTTFRSPLENRCSGKR
ncbi:4Fe-4S binding protein [Desulfobotulus sp. H1]|uniref:4Fe-4S binding protein n=1 Tax=Desulfobotulus pelophilus TaxID=2823377 RepID=A0ABT3N5H4_9BACT|nr:4Fe-4S binding protein [Desulfobotulus pelophilus]MCW7752705.1 4Fe-4S binding protein [Desulfobotulus pelophilus]